MTDNTVTQADREAAASLIAWHNEAASAWVTEGGSDLRFFASDMPDAISQGVWDGHEFVQAFARHRAQATPDSEPVEGLADTVMDMLRAAYSAGAMDVHNNWQEDSAPDFGEAADDYARSIDLAALSSTDAMREAVIEECAQVAMSDWDSLKPHIYNAAIAWCNTKDRETFPEDIAYFENNWSFPGYLRFVIAQAIRALGGQP